MIVLHYIHISIHVTFTALCIPPSRRLSDQHELVPKPQTVVITSQSRIVHERVKVAGATLMSLRFSKQSYSIISRLHCDQTKGVIVVLSLLWRQLDLSRGHSIAPPDLSYGNCVTANFGIYLFKYMISLGEWQSTGSTSIQRLCVI